MPDILTATATVTCGLVAGLLFFASIAVLPALRQLPDDAGADAMRAINVAILNPWFAVVAGGSVLSCVAVLVTAPSALAVGGAVAHLIGAVGVTAAANVPLNNRLAANTVTWAHYQRVWSRWNHVRTLAATVATALLVVG